MGGGNGGVVERAEQGTSVGHDESLERTEQTGGKRRRSHAYRIGRESVSRLYHHSIVQSRDHN
jgi:hypothetical protein